MNEKIIGALIGTTLLMFSSQLISSEPPISKLVEPEGKVEYRRVDSEWKLVKRTKYLFEGYAVRTGENGSARLVNQLNGESKTIKANTEVEVVSSAIKVVSGSVSEPIPGDASFYQSLTNKFAKAQRYTTVRRSAGIGETENCDSKVRTIRKITISASFGDLAWRNACPEYSYRLVIDGGIPIEVAAQSTSEMIRYSVSNLVPGEHAYRVEVLDNDGIVYIPKRDSVLIVLNENEEAALLRELSEIGDDIILRTSFLEERGLFVAMMDSFRQYFGENPDDNGLRPLLIQAYQNLKLSDLREREARLYNASLGAES